jgi:hypothetical protein
MRKLERMFDAFEKLNNQQLSHNSGGAYLNFGTTKDNGTCESTGASKEDPDTDQGPEPNPSDSVPNPPRPNPPVIYVLPTVTDISGPNNITIED